MCVRLLTSIIGLFLFSSAVNAQNLVANTSNGNDLNYVTDFPTVYIGLSDFDEADNGVYYDIPVQTAEYDSQSKTFIISKELSNYSYVELLEVVSNETVKSFRLKGVDRVDMSDVSTGTYYLILTKESGEVHSEKIVVL